MLSVCVCVLHVCSAIAAFWLDPVYIGSGLWDVIVATVSVVLVHCIVV